MGSARILLVEDDARIRTEVTAALNTEGYDAEVAVDLSGARKAVAREYDLLLLDLGLPDGDGVELCLELRDAGRSLPVVVLTARDTPEERVRGLDAGADDYIVKPFHMNELMARVRSVLRRSGRAPAGVIRLGELWADTERRTAGRAEQTFELRRREFDLLLFLLSHPGRPWSRDQLLDRVWGSGFEGDTRTVDIHVRRLRALIETNPASPRLLLTEWGVGYRMEESE